MNGFILCRSAENRPSTNTRTFATKYNLGNPIAANFYQAEYDDYVPTLHAQISGWINPEFIDWIIS